MNVATLINVVKLLVQCTREGTQHLFHNDVSNSGLQEEDEANRSDSVGHRKPQEEDIEATITINDHPPSRRKDKRVGDGPWVGLIEEALAQIFDRLPFQDRLRNVPLVCKEWRRVVRSPWAWQHVDMDHWMRAKADEDCYWEREAHEEVNGIVQAVVDLSGGQLRQLRTGYCTDTSVNYIAENCPLLGELCIRNSFTVGDGSAMNLARKCSRLEKLDLSDCYTVSAKSLESFGVHCPSLAHFSRNMTDIIHYDEVVPPRGDEEAAAIATHMVRLKELQLRRMTSLTECGLMSIASSCSQLEKLDLACCTALSAQALDSVVEVCPKLRDFVRPIKARMHVSDSKYYIVGLYMMS